MFLAPMQASLPIFSSSPALRARVCISVLIALALSLALHFRIYHPLFPLVWLASLALIVPRFRLPELTAAQSSIKSRALTLLVVLSPCLVRALFMGEEVFHGDTIIPAYFAATYDLVAQNFFGPFPDPPNWVARFPTLHFVLQKIFFLLFGESVATVRLSALPYVFIATLGVFFTTRALWGRRAAIIAVLLYATLPPALSIETEAFHFSSSTAPLMGLIAVLAVNFRVKDQSFMLIAGLCCGICYLMYFASYLALPIVLIFLALRARSAGRQTTKKGLVLFAIALFCVLAPFIPGLYQNLWYPLSRIEDVNLFAQIPGSGIEQKLFTYFLKTIDVVSQLFWAPVVGNGGYIFGGNIFLNRPLAFLLIAGIILCIRETSQRAEKWLIVICFFLAVLTLVAASAAPPALHRMSPFFPLIAIFAALPLVRLYESTSASSRLAALLSVVFLLVLGCVDFRRVQVTERRINWDLKEDLETMRYIQRNYPDRVVAVAAHPMFHYPALLRFYGMRNAKSYYHEEAIKMVNPAEKYLYVIFDPTSGNENGTWEEQMAKRDPSGHLVKEHWTKFHLFVN